VRRTRTRGRRGRTARSAGVGEDRADGGAPVSRYSAVPQSHSTVVKAAISNYRKAIGEGLLLKLPFTTIFEYLQLLQMVATSMNCLGHHGMFFLAAAVSDFYVPWESMVGSIFRKCIHVFIIFEKTNHGCPWSRAGLHLKLSVHIR